ncbi:MAG TPA: hypothetical protein PLG67_00780 [Bacillota bacterium]|nr:hypothetical protein [Sedimentibacter sp.]HQL35108.1 hypothetical protein [Bacillota bacterium]
MTRYIVEFKAFETGEWYNKMETDNIASEYSVAKVGSYGRACRLTDIDIGSILSESDEDVSMAEINWHV